MIDCGAGRQIKEVNCANGDWSRAPSSGSADPMNASWSDHPEVRCMCASAEERKRMLWRLLAKVGLSLCWQDRDHLCQLLLSYHEAFAVEEEDRGETDLIQVTIHIGDA